MLLSIHEFCCLKWQLQHPYTHTLCFTLHLTPIPSLFLVLHFFCPLSLSLCWIIEQLSYGWAVVCASVLIPLPQQNQLPWESRMCVRERENWTERESGKKEWVTESTKYTKKIALKPWLSKMCLQCQCVCMSVNVPLCVFVWEKHGKRHFLVQIKPD